MRQVALRRPPCGSTGIPGSAIERRAAHHRLMQAGSWPYRAWIVTHDAPLPGQGWRIG